MHVSTSSVPEQTERTLFPASRALSRLVTPMVPRARLSEMAWLSLISSAMRRAVMLVFPRSNDAVPIARGWRVRALPMKKRLRIGISLVKLPNANGVDQMARLLQQGFVAMYEADSPATAFKPQREPIQNGMDGHRGPDALIHIGWIDVACLTRECVVRAVASEQPQFCIVPFKSVEDCVSYTQRQLEIIVYHSHETRSLNSSDLAVLRQISSSPRLVVLSDAAWIESAQIKAVLHGGASGFILTGGSGLQIVVSALNLVASGGTVIPKEVFLNDGEALPTLRREPGRKAGLLTRRETEVLALMQTGCSNKTIGERLAMSPSTTKVHVRKLMQKLGATNRTQVAMNACQIPVGNAFAGQCAV